MLRGIPKRGIVLVALILFGSGCGEANTPFDAQAPDAQDTSIDARIDGVWRLTNYIPEKELSPEVLMNMQSDSILVRFEQGTVRSLSSSLQFERKYRIATVRGDTFHLFVEASEGVEVESVCELNDQGTLSFEALTDPWKGRGVLSREGTALKRPL